MIMKHTMQYSTLPDTLPIKAIFEPGVYLVGHTTAVGDGLDKYVEEHGSIGNSKSGDQPNDAERLVEIAGRLCYMSFDRPRPGASEAYFYNILKSKHFSVVEHANFSFLLTGISRSLTHEFVRHRHHSYSQLSQRYVDESDVAFVVPPELRGTSEYSDWVDAMVSSQAAYRSLVDKLEKRLADEPIAKTEKRKRVRQTARSVLPNSTETKMFVTGNARSWRSFLSKRAVRHADTEIRNLAGLILLRLAQESPLMFGDFVPSEEFAGEWSTPNTEV